MINHNVPRQVEKLRARANTKRLTAKSIRHKERYLSDIYLQHPIYQHDDMSYDNPHFVEIHGISPEEDMLPDQSAAEVIDASQCGPLASSVQLRLDEAVSEAFDSLNRLKRLSQLEAPCCIRTPLLEYMIFQDPIASKTSDVHGKASKRRFRLHSPTRIWTCTRRVFVVAAVRTPGTRLVSLSIVFRTVSHVPAAMSTRSQAQRLHLYRLRPVVVFSRMTWV